MKIAVITDIHGNIFALNKALELIDTIGVDRIICLGDIIGKGTDDILCLETIITSNITTVAGNWETYINRGIDNFRNDIKDFEAFKLIDNSLTEKQRNWLKSLPFEYEIEVKGKRLLFMHYLIEDIDKLFPYHLLKTLENGDFQRLINKLDYDYMYFGHRHYERHSDNAMIVPALGLNRNQFLIIEIYEDLVNHTIINVK